MVSVCCTIAALEPAVLRLCNLSMGGVCSECWLGKGENNEELTFSIYNSTRPHRPACTPSEIFQLVCKLFHVPSSCRDSLIHRYMQWLAFPDCCWLLACHPLLPV